MRALLIIGLTGLAFACNASNADVVPNKAQAVAPPLLARGLALPKPWTDEALTGEAERYLTDSAFRRSILEASLTSKENIYARTRLSGYGLEGRGWEMLPEWTPRTVAIDDAYVTGLVGGQPLAIDATVRPLWDGIRPTTMSEWTALGRKVFYEYPLRSEIFAEHALRSPELSARVGLQSDDKGLWPGVVAFQSPDGSAEIGITCALCHVSIEDGTMVEGQAHRDFDYGEMRLAYYRDTGAFLDEDVRQRMERWGPGRADITQDDDEDPVAIVDLWGARDHDYLTQSGTIRHLHPAAMAIRQETQLLHANQERVRPPRELAWALAMFVYSLTPPERVTRTPDAQTAHGEALFTEHCAYCHRDKNYGGLPVSAASIGTDPVLARGSARGTGLYRPTPLLRVAEAAPYLHDGSVPTLADLLDSARTVPGHRYGVDLPEADRDALLAFLKSL